MEKIKVNLKEIENTLEKCGNIVEPMFIKRKNFNELIIIDKEALERMFDQELIYHLKEAEEDVKNGRIRSVEEVFEELDKKYDI